MGVLFIWSQNASIFAFTWDFKALVFPPLGCIGERYSGEPEEWVSMDFFAYLFKLLLSFITDYFIILTLSFTYLLF